MPKSPAQLDAEIAEVLQGNTNCDSAALNALIKQIESAIDAHPELTRERPGKRGSEEAELIFSRGDWTARCKCRIDELSTASSITCNSIVHYLSVRSRLRHDEWDDQ